MQRDAVPLLGIGGVGQDELHLLARIVDQRRELVDLGARHAVAEQIVQRLAHHAGAGVQDVQKCLVLAVHVGNEMLRALGQVHDRLQVDDFRARRAYRGELAREHAQIPQLFGRIGLMLLHETNPPFLRQTGGQSLLPI